jgi:hypothetical protein
MNALSLAQKSCVLTVLGCAAACGSSSGPAGGPPPADAGRESDSSHDSGTPPVDSAQGMDAREASAQDTAPPDSSSTDPLTALTACLGTKKTLTISGQMPFYDVPIGTLSGEFVLDFASTYSSIDLSAFPSPGPMTSGCDASELGQVCTVADFAFFSTPGDVELVTEDFSDIMGTVRQAGILATDFLSEHILTLGYSAGLVFASPASSFCSDAQMTSAGFLPLSTAGFYENDLSLLEPLTDVDSAGSSGTSVPNVPTVSVSVAGAKALAQLDTGFDDDVTPFSVNINPAFLAEINGANPSALVRDASLDATLTTCVEGVDETVEAYTLGAGTTFDFVADGGTVARSYASAVLFVKNTPASAASCGGIGTWTAPAAQVAASYYNDMKVIAFDPYGARVWIPKL